MHLPKLRYVSKYESPLDTALKRMIPMSDTAGKTKTLFRYADGVWPNIGIFAYMGLGYPAGVALLVAHGVIANSLGVLLVAHTLIVSAYIIHECTHGTIFTRPADNDLLGKVMAWVNGAAIAPYAGLKEKHLRHHADRADVVTFDYRAILLAAPAWFRHAILALEWAYIPAVEFLMRALVAITPFQENDRHGRTRVLTVLAVRLAFFIALAAVSIKAVMLYALAYVIFLHVLRFQDAFQHTFEVYPTRTLAPIPAEKRRDRAYEHANTYSDVVSYGIPWLNFLLLNFPYHNAHHARPAAPWYQLTKLHDQLYGSDQAQVLPCRTLVKNYHRHRVTRVLAADYGEVAPATIPGAPRVDNFLGAVGVSFLTAV
jgi:fatty acid desaturase